MKEKKGKKLGKGIWLEYWRKVIKSIIQAARIFMDIFYWINHMLGIDIDS